MVSMTQPLFVRDMANLKDELFAPAAKPPVALFGQGATLRQKRTAVTIASANTDVATFTGLPSKYLVTGFRVYDTSTSLALSIATVGLCTASGGGGTVMVSPAVLTSLASPDDTFSMAIILPNAYQIAPVLYVRNVVSHGSAATVTFQLEILDLS